MAAILASFGALGGAAPASAQRFDAWCVGGPRAPAYAFRSRWRAQQCEDRVASYGNDCRRAVRLARCRVFSHWSIDRTPASYCQCNPPYGNYIGRW